MKRKNHKLTEHELQVQKTKMKNSLRNLGHFLIMSFALIFIASVLWATAFESSDPLAASYIQLLFSIIKLVIAVGVVSAILYYVISPLLHSIKYAIIRYKLIKQTRLMKSQDNNLLFENINEEKLEKAANVLIELGSIKPFGGIHNETEK